jgi:hypothetical protein
MHLLPIQISLIHTGKKQGIDNTIILVKDFSNGSASLRKGLLVNLIFFTQFGKEVVIFPHSSHPLCD